MAIKIADKFSLRSGSFLDSRQGEADNISDLKNWDFNNNPLPEGFEVYVKETKSWYYYVGPGFVPDPVTGLFKLRKVKGNFIPIYDKTTLDKLSDEEKREKHIVIPNQNEDLNGGINEETITLSKTGNYVDILFSAIRSLQSEVAKLRNSFKYGINSYTGETTAYSGMINNTPSLPTVEPLWAIDENNLSSISDGDILNGEGIKINVATDFTPVSPGTGFAVIRNKVVWEKGKNLGENEDSKLFYYLTVSKPEIVFKFGEQGSSVDSLPSFEIRMDNLVTEGAGDGKVQYDVMVIVSRKDKPDPEFPGLKLGGENFIYFHITSRLTGRTVAKGYYNKATRSLGKYKPGSGLELDKRMTINKVELGKPGEVLYLYKFNTYSMIQSFSTDVVPSKPDEDEYKFKVAHITIRSVQTKLILDNLKTRLMDNELIYVEEEKALFIKSKNNLIPLGGSRILDNNKPEEDSMTREEVIKILREQGIISGENNDLKLNNISDITFIHEGTGKSFRLGIDSEGSVVSRELVKPGELLDKKLEYLDSTQFSIKKDENQFRGFVSRLWAGLDEKNTTIQSDLKLNSDRVKIASVYCPLKTDVAFGCSHAYIELENTSDKDFPLDGCFLHYLHPTPTGQSMVEHLRLEGILKAGSTFLIRGKEYSSRRVSSNVFLEVDDFDMEWYIGGKLLDTTNDGVSAYAFALTYGKEDLNPDTQMVTQNLDSTKEKAPFLFSWYFIDSLILNKAENLNTPWGSLAVKVSSNSIIKNTFLLDPARQAFQSLNKFDSSRTKFQSTNDIQVLDLSNEYITFPHTEEKCPVSIFTPRSSKQKRTVCTDKTKPDPEKPNMVTVSFGIDIFKTRCFNWISIGSFDEYVWIKDGESWRGFESYKKVSEDPVKPGNHTPTPYRKEFGMDVINNIYSRMNGIFPGEGSFYTSHKCILEVMSDSELSSLSTPKTFTYKVGRAKIKEYTSSGQVTYEPDPEHTSQEMTFTIYPMSYKPRVYQTTDQQGFHWIEYQVWGASARYLDERIKKEVKSENIIPILYNTGDMTQNGTRINEWLDYYIGGQSLFSHLEQMNITGNNDLCGTDPEVLGTGDDVGKSNSYYFHLFYCYEIDESPGILPLIPSSDGKQKKYVPSLYYFLAGDYGFVMVNSEITYINCKDWYKRTFDIERAGVLEKQAVNVYTGYGVPESGDEISKGYDSGFTTIYTMVRNILEKLKGKKLLLATHEMPFTVITSKDLVNNPKNKTSYRSISGTSLVGSHMNQMTVNDTKGIHWFSRLLEHYGVKLCLGGHKHTYTATLPVRENYKYSENGLSKTSFDNGPMKMAETLENDNIDWFDEGGAKNLTKFPLINKEMTGLDSSLFLPFTYKPGLIGGVVYFMCQATGYKLKSNRELPSTNQAFSSLIPKTAGDANKPKPANEQQYPMFSIIDFNDSTKAKVKLVRLTNIMDDKNKHVFNQKDHGKGEIKPEYAKPSDTQFCRWVEDENVIVEVTF